MFCVAILHKQTIVEARAMNELDSQRIVLGLQGPGARTTFESACYTVEISRV